MHLWVGSDMEEMPQTGNKKKDNGNPGNPKVGHFPYWHSSEGTTSYSLYVPLEDLGDLGLDCSETDGIDDSNESYTFYMAAYAQVMNADGDTEGSWSKPHIWMQNGGNWITYSSLNFPAVVMMTLARQPLHTMTRTPPVSWILTWTLMVLTILTAGDGATGLLALANTHSTFTQAQDNVTRARETLVGSLKVDYTDGSVEIEYDLVEPFTLDEVHLYAGCDMLPTANGTYTVAPGQYYVKEDLETCVGGIYVVAHSVVCGDFGGDNDEDEEE